MNQELQQPVIPEISETLPPAEAPADVDHVEQKEPVYETGNEPTTPEEKSAHFQKRLERERRKYDDKYRTEVEPLKVEVENLKQELHGLKNSYAPSAQPGSDTQPDITDVLANAVDVALEKREHKRLTQEQQQQRSELIAEHQRLTAEYYDRLQEGAQKYGDFQNVVFDQEGRPSVSTTMIEALKTTDDPAAVLYNASKFHKEELRRIMSIRNENIQFAEMVRLQDKIKSRLTPNTVTNAPSPVHPDYSGEGYVKGPIVSPSDIKKHFDEQWQKRRARR